MSAVRAGSHVLRISTACDLLFDFYTYAMHPDMISLIEYSKRGRDGRQRHASARGYPGFVVGGLIYLCVSVRSPIPSYYFILVPELSQGKEERPDPKLSDTRQMVNLMKAKMNIPKILDFKNYFIKDYFCSACVANIIRRLFTFACLPDK